MLGITTSDKETNLETVNHYGTDIVDEEV